MLRRTPLRRKTPLRQSNGRRPSAEERRHMDRVASLGCRVCGGEATLHHVTASIHGGRIARSHARVVGLCPRHHLIQWGPRESVEALGHGGFWRAYGIDLLAEADRLWEESSNAASHS